jgi:hypothetical protein
MSRSWPLLGAAVPGLLLSLALAAATAGIAPALSADDSINVSEAVALNDLAEVVRLVRLGEDPNTTSIVRRHIIRGRDDRLTPLEAAVATRRAEALELLVSLGAVVHQQNFPRLWCFAQRSEDATVIAFLERRRPDPGSIDCAAVTTPW